MSVASFLFAGMSLFGRIAGTNHVPWALIGFIRAVAGVVVAYGFARVRGAPIVLSGSPAMWLRSIGGSIAMILTFYVLGSPNLALGDAATLFNLMPIFVAMFAPFVIRERTGKRLALALPVALIGVLLVVKPPALFGTHAEPSDPKLVLAALGAAVSSAFAMLGLRRVGARENIASITLHFSLVASTLMAIFLLPTFSVPSAHDLTVMIGAGACAAVAQIAMTKAYALERAALVSSYGYLNVIFTALLAAAVLGEIPDALAMFGMALVIAAGAVVTLAHSFVRAA